MSSMTPNFCTLFDINYVRKGIALIDSMYAHMPEFHVCVLALDLETAGKLYEEYGAFNEHVNMVSLAEVESAVPKLMAASLDRTWQEYCWTLGSVFLRYCYEDGQDPWAYIDADCFLFGDMAELYRMVQGYDCAVIPHRWDADQEDRLSVNGQFNVSWTYIGNTLGGMNCVNRWANQCLEWCYYRQESRKFADQKYLDEWPHLYDCAVIDSPGVGLAPWGLKDHEYEVRGDGALYIDGWPLLMYHFHGLTIEDGVVNRSKYKIPWVIEKEVYTSYERALLDSRLQADQFPNGL